MDLAFAACLTGSTGARRTNKSIEFISNIKDSFILSCGRPPRSPLQPPGDTCTFASRRSPCCLGSASGAACLAGATLHGTASDSTPRSAHRFFTAFFRRNHGRMINPTIVRKLTSLHPTTAPTHVLQRDASAGRQLIRSKTRNEETEAQISAKASPSALPNSTSTTATNNPQRQL
jgi:hypothetical protein